MATYRLCIVKPNQNAFSETFIREHETRLSGEKQVIYGGAFPVYDHEGKYLIPSWIGLALYLFQKRILKQQNIAVRTQALARYFKAQRTQVVFAEYGFTGAMITPACREAGIPLVVHFHGADAHHSATVEQYQTAYRDMFAYASAIVAVSVDMVDKLKALGAPADKIFWVPCGVDVDQFKQLSLSEAPHFLSVGRFVDKKAPQLLVKAFKKVHAALPNAKLWMVGSGPLLEATQALAGDLGLETAITFTGVLPPEKIRELMGKTRCFVQHSLTAADGDMEGTPVTILEAAASALPIVSTRHAGIKQAVLDGQSGYLVDEGDVEAMADRMLQIAAASMDELRAMGQAGRAHIEKNYAIRLQIAKLDQIIQNSLKH